MQERQEFRHDQSFNKRRQCCILMENFATERTEISEQLWKICLLTLRKQSSVEKCK